MTDHTDELPDLEEIIALMPGNIYWKNKKGVYLGCNDNAAKLIRLNSRKEVIGKTLYDIAPAEVADEITQIDDEIMSSSQESAVEEEAFDLDGNPATYFTRKIPLKNETGKVIGLAGISIDITERKQYERALKEEKEKAEAANKAKSEFIMNMSHDIRTPFSGILGLSQYLENNETDAEKKDILHSIVESTQNLLDILNEVIHLASIENENDSPICNFNLSKCISSVHSTLLPETKRKGLHFNLTIDPSLPIHVYGDEYAVKRILLNLAGNAVKFTDKGKVSISASLKEKDFDKYIVELKVSDTGIGIPKDKQELIFEQFCKLNSSYRSKYAGTGLGLWFVKKLTERMNGTIDLESRPFQGSTFTITFPIVEQSKS